MVIQFGVRQHIRMAETYRWAEEELVKYLRIQNELIDDSKRYWNGETAESFRQDYEYMLQEGEYAAFLKHVRGMKEVMEESIPRLRRLQQMVVELPTAYGLPCDEEAPETLRLDEEAVARYHELSDELIARKYHFYEEMTSVMDGCEGLVDFSEDRRELEKLLDEIQQMKTYKRMLDEYADEMRRMDNWMVERLSEYVKIGDGNYSNQKASQVNISQYYKNLESGKVVLFNYMMTYELADENEIHNFIEWIESERPDLLVNLYIVDSNSGNEVWELYDRIFNDLDCGDNIQFAEIINKYNLIIRMCDVESLVIMGEPLNEIQKETFVACWNMLVGMGLSLEQIIGVMANIYAEGKMCPTNAEDGKIITTEEGEILLESGKIDDINEYVYRFNDGVGYGICQWTYSSRKEELYQMAQNMNSEVSDINVQLSFLRFEMENWSRTDTKMESYSLDDFLRINTIDEAVEEFMIHFENPYLEPANRLIYAQDIEQWHSNVKGDI